MDKKVSLHSNSIRIKKDPWVFSTLILGVILIVLIVLLALGKVSFAGVSGGSINGDDAGIKVADFLNARVGGGGLAKQIISLMTLAGYYWKRISEKITLNQTVQTLPD